MKTKCLIVDDEPLSIKLIKGYIGELHDFLIIGEARNSLDALKIIEEESVDLIFLDINMPRISGLDLIRSMQYPPKVIIISAHKEFAIDGFELNVVDFLLKPVSFDRFLRAINKYKRALNKETVRSKKNENLLNDYIISLKDNKKVYNINLKDVLYIESMREYVKFYNTSGHILIKCALSKLDEALPSEQFIRVHKSFIVAIKKVRIFSATAVEIGDKKIPIGRSFKNAVIKELNNGILL